MNKHRGYMREQVIEKLLSFDYPKKPFGYFEGGKFCTGQKSLHRTPKARMFRTMIRMTRYL